MISERSSIWLPLRGRHQSSIYPDRGEEWQERTAFIKWFSNRVHGDDSDKIEFAVSLLEILVPHIPNGGGIHSNCASVMIGLYVHKSWYEDIL